MHNLFFIGMPGCGKTFWAKQIADALGYIHFDTDRLIIAKAGKSITTIFEEEGEPFFREMESNVLKELVEVNERFICSTGGGLPINSDNFSLMKLQGKTIYLQASIPYLINHLKKEIAQRPFLVGDNIEEKLQLLFKKRKTIYEQADITFKVEQITLSQILTTIQK